MGVRLAEKVVSMVRTIYDGGVVHQPTMDSISELRADIGRQVEIIAERAKRRHIEAWRTWLRKGIDAGARNAHRYTRIPSLWRPQPMVTPDGVVTASTEGMVDAYRAKYIRRWNGQLGGDSETRPRTDAPWLRAARCALPRPTIDDIRSASRAFPADTATAYDGFAMRHYSLVSDAGLRTLSLVIVAMEGIGSLPPQFDALVMPMIGKERGGHRAITTATSLYRLWGRVRRPYSQEWEARHERSYFASGKGRRVQDTVWRQLVRAEAGDGAAKTSATVLWDLASYYDTLNRARLWRMVRKYDFPLAMARLAFSSYDAPRTLVLEGRVSKPTYARDGVPAGCPYASAFSRLYSIEPFDDFIAMEVMQDADDADFDAYVDDLVLSAIGSEDHVYDTRSK